ncbi:PHA/PHB synthase family protein [Mangrovitalea sediminis]|uniref:PHA/PHB synthase family protein n=1 Tax=Mangrovitalea sediminis TaxID=1982043 RepID=UPI000BE60559|nr:class I poly(R)-hydroxyalkanoic acid synthase [Mangrovitalea sediminis]
MTESGQGFFRRAFNRLDSAAASARQQMEDWVSGWGAVDDAQLSTLAEMGDAYRRMLEDALVHPLRVVGLEAEWLRQQMRLLGYLGSRLSGGHPEPVALPAPDDRRFRAADWDKYAVFDYLKQAYLINTRLAMDLIDQTATGPEHQRDQLRFFARQLLSAFSPSNFVPTNPEVLRITMERKGQNLVDGARYFLQDLRNNPRLFNVAMTDTDAFEVGRNVATTPGEVIYQNDLMQLIQYRPATETVFQRPLLIVPPWINKYYILDLKPKNSLIQWLVEQGFTVFIISWVNPGPSLRDKGFEDYMQEGPLAAIEAIQQATGEKQINAIGYCIGGTLLAATLAWLAEKGRKPVVSTTYLATLMDFSDPGGIGVFINEHLIKAVERLINKTGYYDGRAMAFSFNLLRENELFWSFWINSYLKGEKPAAFDLLYWNTDSTNLPARMHSFYLRNMYLHNRLIEPGGINLSGVPIDLRKIRIPAFFLSAEQDHIAKWKATYKGARVHSGDVRFVLSGSGHIAGVVNPPAAHKYGYWTNDSLAETPDEWMAGAERHEGSWWPEWKRWIEAYAGPMVPARQPGDGALPSLEAAPGHYVQQRISDIAGS